VPGAPPPPCVKRAPPAEKVDAQITDVEITQGVQPDVAHTVTDGTGARTRAYGAHEGEAGEVPLLVDRKTVVRVYADLRSGPPGGIANVPATLEAVNGGRHFGPIEPDASPSTLRLETSTLLESERKSPAGAYTFTIPDEWVHGAGTLDFIARVNPAGIDCDAACQARSTFRLTGVTFNYVRLATVWPVALTVNGVYPTLSDGTVLTSPDAIYDVPRLLTPYNLEIRGWMGQIEVGDIVRATKVSYDICFLGIQLGITCRTKTVTITAGDKDSRSLLQDMIFKRLAQLGHVSEATLRMGLMSDARPTILAGATRGTFFSLSPLPQRSPDPPLVYAVVTRPYTSVAHELQHALGRPHASFCGGGGDNDQVAEKWPDEQGSLQGIGLDTRAGSGGGRGPYKIVYQGVSGYPTTMFDIMSYCAGEDSSWISPLGWNEVVHFHTGVVHSTRRPASSAATRFLHVDGVELLDGTLAITGVSPTTSSTGSAPASSPYRLEARDSHHRILVSVPAGVTFAPDGGGTFISGEVRAPAGTAEVVLRKGTKAAARVRGSAHSPRVRLLAPRPGIRVTGRGLDVRWRASDPDGGTLTTTVDYSTDGGRNWRTLSVGPTRGTVTVPIELLEGSSNARVRVRVDDGFNEGVAVSGRIAVVAPPPQVRIIDPSSGLRVRADAPLYLRGTAIGGGGLLLQGSKVKWFDGKRLLGTGTTLSVTGLSPGRHTIQLVAGERGSTGTATVNVTVIAVKPAFLRLDAPARVASTARSVKLKVASSVGATLTVAGQSFPVSPTARTVSVRIPRGDGAVKLTLTLRAGPLSTTHVLEIPRG
jgi:hypothetical protein